MNLSKAIKLAHKYKLRTLRELEIFTFIANNTGGHPVTIKMIEKGTGYPYTSIKKITYKLGTGRESGYNGYELITYRKSPEVVGPGPTKVIKLTAKGKKFAEKLNQLMSIKK